MINLEVRFIISACPVRSLRILNIETSLLYFHHDPVEAFVI